MHNPIFLLCDLCNSTASFTKLPSNLKKFISRQEIPPLKSIKKIAKDAVRDDEYTYVQRLSKQLKSDRGKPIKIGMYYKETSVPKSREVSDTIRAAKNYITPPVLAASNKSFVQLDGGEQLMKTKLTPKEAYKVGRQTKRLEEKGLYIGMQHKDIHPGNVVLNKKKNKAYLIDWDNTVSYEKPDLYTQDPKTRKYLMAGYEAPRNKKDVGLAPKTIEEKRKNLKQKYGIQ